MDYSHSKQETINNIWNSIATCVKNISYHSAILQQTVLSAISIYVWKHPKKYDIAHTGIGIQPQFVLVRNTLLPCNILKMCISRSFGSPWLGVGIMLFGTTNDPRLHPSTEGHRLVVHKPIIISAAYMYLRYGLSSENGLDHKIIYSVYAQAWLDAI